MSGYCAGRATEKATDAASATGASQSEWYSASNHDCELGSGWRTRCALPSGQPGVYPDVQVLAAPVLALGSVGGVPPGPGVVEGNEIPYKPEAGCNEEG